MKHKTIRINDKLNDLLQFCLHMREGVTVSFICRAAFRADCVISQEIIDTMTSSGKHRINVQYELCKDLCDRDVRMVLSSYMLSQFKKYKPYRRHIRGNYELAGGE